MLYLCVLCCVHVGPGKNKDFLVEYTPMVMFVLARSWGRMDSIIHSRCCPGQCQVGTYHTLSNLVIVCLSGPSYQSPMHLIPSCQR